MPAFFPVRRQDYQFYCLFLQRCVFCIIVIMMLKSVKEINNKMKCDFYTFADYKFVLFTKYNCQTDISLFKINL